jgi:ATP-dependent protease La (Lon)-like substrate-binding protein/C3HC4-type zinc finger (RING finger) protein/RING finger family protein
MESPSSELRQLGFRELYPSNLHQLLGCKKCGNILQNPVTTACGSSYCRSCIAPTGNDKNATKSACPKDACREYTNRDCPIDLTLDTVLQLLIGFLNKPIPDENILSTVQKTLEATDHFECVVCYKRFFGPVTLRCGHTFCQDCIRRCIDALDACPYCRAPFPWPFSGTMDHHDPLKGWSYNLILASIITTCWSSELTDLQISYNVANRIVPPDMEIPLFVTTTGHPGQITQLKIFEPRYRLFLRRVMESPSRTFGMVMRKPQNFSTGPGIYGTMLRIEELWYPREKGIRIKAIGLSRFKVTAAKQWTQYWTAKIELVPEHEIPDDMVNWDYVQVAPRPFDLRLLVYAYGYNPQNPISLQWMWEFKSCNPSSIPGFFPEFLTNRQIILLLREYLRMRFDLHTIEREDWVRRYWGDPPESHQEFVWYLANIAQVLRWWNAGDELLRTTDLRSRLNKLFGLVIDHIPRSITQNWDSHD